MKIGAERLTRLGVLIDEGSFSRAARRLNLTQPTLTESISQLEHELNVKLVERSRHGIVPTAFGERLYQRAKAVTAELEKAADDVAPISHIRRVRLAIGTSTGSELQLVCAAVSRMVANHPKLTISLAENPSQDILISLLKRRDLDIAVGASWTGVKDDWMEEFPLFKTNRVLVARCGHPYFCEPSKDLRSLLKYCPILPDGASESYWTVMDHLRRIGPFDLQSAVFAQSIFVAKQILFSSDCFAFLPESSVLAELNNNLLQIAKVPWPTEYWYKLRLNRAAKMPPLLRPFLKEIIAVSAAFRVTPSSELLSFLHCD
jgi:DNA-binding transcriptional LysR family regulator